MAYIYEFNSMKFSIFDFKLDHKQIFNFRKKTNM
jgi:hypothetical protein